MASLRYASGPEQHALLNALFGTMSQSSASSSSSASGSKTGTAGGGEGKDGGVGGSKLGLKIGAVLKKGKKVSVKTAAVEKEKKEKAGGGDEKKNSGSSSASGDSSGGGGDSDHGPDTNDWSFLTRLLMDLLHPQGLYQSCVKELVRGQTNGRWESVLKRGVRESNGELLFHLIVSGNRVGVKNGLHRGARCVRMQDTVSLEIYCHPHLSPHSLLRRITISLNPP